ncbi:beta-1,4-galactosyltransferase 1-like [Dreissena polymorpha]|uniref:beta-1,4-galactosyltransferase 1-like n=1 Tax=Dreissena polymorpha TaxID=45954 RepID=UPI0022643B74|nr:beta-1,4-galactosyltransferase 1-like [Dreissena polymorpha]
MNLDVYVFNAFKTNATNTAESGNYLISGKGTESTKQNTNEVTSDRNSTGPVTTSNTTNSSYQGTESTKQRVTVSQISTAKPPSTTSNNTNSSYQEKSPCLSKEGVAIVVPYRNREEHLRVFIEEIVPFIQRQNISFHIFIIEQSQKAGFNRAKLFNIGFKESKSVGNFSCFIFHDVDLIPTSPDNYYCCESNPKHMSVGNEKFNFKLPYGDYVGGVLAMTTESFLKTNGFSNAYFGWGGEDDDMNVRIKSAGLKTVRPSIIVGRYKALRHVQAVPGQDRFKLVETAKQRITSDGIYTLNYTLLAKNTDGLTTHIKADIDAT